MKKMAIFLLVATYGLFLLASDSQYAQYTKTNYPIPDPNTYPLYVTRLQYMEPPSQLGEIMESFGINQHPSQPQEVFQPLMQTLGINQFFKQPEEIYQPLLPSQEMHQPIAVNNGTEQKKTFLQTVFPVEQNSDVKKELFKYANELVKYYTNNMAKLAGVIKDKRLPELILKVNNPREFFINEREMAKYAFEYHREASTSLVFSCLYDYRLQALPTFEAIPNFDGPVKYSMLLQYPAFAKFADCFTDIIKFPQAADIFANFLHADDQNQLTADHWSGFHDHSIVREYYAKAYDLLRLNSGDDKEIIKRVYELVQLVANAKQSGQIDHEHSLGYEIFDYDPEETVLNNVKGIFNKKFDIDSIKKRLRVICLFIAEYNEAKLNRNTPTPNQYTCRNLQAEINITMPFGTALLNEEFYAFDAFQQLIKSTKDLMSFDDQKVQQLIDKIHLSF